MLTFRNGSPNDLDAIMALFDANVAWLVGEGRAEQWGSDPWSTDPGKAQFVFDLLASGVVTIAEINGEAVGASVVSDHPMPYVPTVDHNERYLRLLIASPHHRGMGIGRHLIARARQLAVADGVPLLRVDCWSGGDGKLVAYYAREGFIPTQEIEVRPGTSVQVFEWWTGNGTT